MTTAPPKPKRTRRSQLTITGRLVPPGSSPPNPDHPLANLTPDERLEVALEALGKLILGVVEDERMERLAAQVPTGTSVAAAEQL